MRGMQFLIDAIVKSLGIDPAKFQAIFEQVQKEGPALIETIRSKAVSMDARLSRIDDNMDYRLSRIEERLGIPWKGEPQGDNFTAHSHTGNEHEVN